MAAHDHELGLESADVSAHRFLDARRFSVITKVCAIVYAMTSKYAIALYEMIARANMDRCVETTTLEKFRDRLGVPPGAYDRGDNFTRCVIKPALLEVNGLSDMGVQTEMQRCCTVRLPGINLARINRVRFEKRPTPVRQRRPGAPNLVPGIANPRRHQNGR